jgi:non-heme chloroperoxidase
MGRGAAHAHYQCIAVFSETDQTEDLKAMTVPTLVMHGDDDQVVPIGNSAEKAIKLLPKGDLKVYPGLSHGFFATHPDLVNADLLDFARS